MSCVQRGGGADLQEEERDISCPSRCLLVCRHPLAHAATPEASMVRAGFLPLPPLISLPLCSREGRRHRTHRGCREGKGKWKNEYRFSKSLCTSGCRNPSPVGAPVWAHRQDSGNHVPLNVVWQAWKTLFPQLVSVLEISPLVFRFCSGGLVMWLSLVNPAVLP